MWWLLNPCAVSKCFANRRVPSLSLTSSARFSFSPFMCVTKEKAEARTLACYACFVIQGKVMLTQHTQRWPAASARIWSTLDWVIFGLGGVLCQLGRKRMYKGWKKTWERVEIAAYGEGTNKRLAKKSETKDKVPSASLLWPCKLRESRVMLGS